MRPAPAGALRERPEVIACAHPDRPDAPPRSGLLRADWSIYAGGALLAASSVSATLQDLLGESSLLTVNLLAGCGAVVLAAGAFLQVVQTGRLGFPRSLRTPLMLLAVWVLVGGVRGWLAGNDRQAIVFDLLPYLIFFAVVHFSSSSATDTAFRRVMVWTMASGALIALASLGTLNYFERADALQSDAYKAQWALAYWPLFLWAPRVRRTGTTLVTIGSVAFALTLILQVLAQKRAPTVRVIILFLLAWLLTAGVTRLQATAVRLIGASLVLIALSLVVLDATVFRRASDGLADRFTEALLQETLFTENARVDEAEWIIADFSAIELLVGRGLGGAVVPRATVAWTQDNTVRAPHIGMALHLLKGGAVLILIFLFLYGRTVWHAGQTLGSTTGPVAAVVLTTALFQWQETLWGVPCATQVVVLAYAIGKIGSTRHDAKS